MLRYRLDDLGWYQFECMVQSLLKANLGMGIESWAGRGDHGRDAFFKDSLEFPIKGNLQEGPFIFQVKFVEEANAAGANPRPRILSAVKSELNIIKRRGRLQKIKIVYSFFTNVYLSPGLREELNKLLIESLPLSNVVLMGGQDICDLLDNSPGIRVSFPQILSLRDLDILLNDIVAKPIIERSRGMIEEARELSLIFYPTNAYSETIRKLTLHNFSVLEGPPEVGKTAIARMIGLSRVSIGWEAHECLLPNEFFQLLSNERHQIFIADDAFGSTEYDPARTNEWSNNLDRILRRLDHNHWLIWTARKHILEIALQHMRLQGKAESFPEPSSIIVDAGNLTTTEKAMILYRHAKAAGFENVARDLLKRYAGTIVANIYFTPERIRRFVKDSFPTLIDDFIRGKLTAEALTQAIIKEIQEPTRSLKQAFDCLPESHKRVLVSRLDIGPKLFIKSDELSQSFERHRPQVLDKPYEELESDLTLSFLKPLKKYYYGVGWVHPSMRDLVIIYLINNKNARHEFLSKCSIGGISLALSIGGGSEGTRTFPLVIDYGDQVIIRQRIKELIHIINLEELDSLLENIYEAKIKINELEGMEITNFINEIYDIAIDELLIRWGNNNELIDTKLLTLYYKMAKQSKAFRPTPPLKYTWDKLFGEIIDIIYDPNDYVETGYYSEIDNYLDFVAIIEQEDQRFLRYVNFPDCFYELAKNIINASITYSESDYSISSVSISNYDLYSSEAEKYKKLREMAEKIFNLDIKLKIEIKPEEALELIDRAISKWEEMAQEEGEPEPDHDDRSSRHEDYIDIGALFSDL